MKQFIQDPIVSLKIDGVVSELHPELTEDQIREVSHFVFHRMNVIPLYDQAKELIEEYIEEELGINS
mgnify:CR=1 FL=1|jgi:hypothetical protein|tara:strand:+ start:356 stop:556 length:201 start_codon:yes stop_codon:yes gene_type:complete